MIFHMPEEKWEAKHTICGGRSICLCSCLSALPHVWNLGGPSTSLHWWGRESVQPCWVSFPITPLRAGEHRPNGSLSRKIIFSPSSIYMYLYHTSLFKVAQQFAKQINSPFIYEGEGCWCVCVCVCGESWGVRLLRGWGVFRGGGGGGTEGSKYFLWLATAQWKHTPDADVY